MHSPWGFLFAVASELGWTRHEILWKVSLLNLQLMLADRPGTSYVKKENKGLSFAELEAKMKSSLKHP